MGFWIFMLVMELLIPVTMIGFGRRFEKKAPKTINWVFGYRTVMSMKNMETWEYAHKTFGKFWFGIGLVLLTASIMAMLFVIGKDKNMVGITGSIVCCVQIVGMLFPIIPTEIRLRKKIDKTGNRKYEIE